MQIRHLVQNINMEARWSCRHFMFQIYLSLWAVPKSKHCNTGTDHNQNRWMSWSRIIPRPQRNSSTEQEIWSSLESWKLGIKSILRSSRWDSIKFWTTALPFNFWWRTDLETSIHSSSKQHITEATSKGWMGRMVDQLIHKTAESTSSILPCRAVRLPMASQKPSATSHPEQ